MAPSGVGKTTLLAVLGGLLKPQSGSVVIRVAESNQERFPSDVTVSWVFQEMNLLTARTALDNVAIAAMARGHRRREAELLAFEALDQFGVGDLAQRRLLSLSGGQSQRIALARAVVGEPMLVLADEPTAKLDHKTAMAVAESLTKGFPQAPVVVATHDRAVADLADAVYTMRDGRLELNS
jgi:ABC-type lipoprotein export system ATPase subunit